MSVTDVPSQRATTSSVAVSAGVALVPTMMSKRPGSTTRCIRRSISDSSSGPSVKLTVFDSPGCSVTRAKPRSSLTGRVTELT